MSRYAWLFPLVVVACARHEPPAPAPPEPPAPKEAASATTLSGAAPAAEPAETSPAPTAPAGESDDAGEPESAVGFGRETPFGPMLAAGAVLYFLWLHPIVDGYFAEFHKLLTDFS